MIRLLIIADDFTGALDTGVKFSAAGASTKIITDVHTNFTGDGPEVLVLCVPTRHLSPREAYEAVRPVVERAAAALSARNQSPALVTLGENGAVWCEGGVCTHVPAYRVEPPIDFVGAGDAFLAGFSLAHALQIPPADRLAFACLVPAVTIQKLGTTGTASPAELRRELARQTGDAL